MGGILRIKRAGTETVNIGVIELKPNLIDRKGSYLYYYRFVLLPDR